MTRRRGRNTLTHWKSGELPAEVFTVARNRTAAMCHVFGNGETTVNTLVTSAYLQGINDTMEMLMSRFPRQIEKMFGNGIDQDFPEIEVM